MVHTIEVEMKFREGPRNDDVKVFVDGDARDHRHELGGLLPLLRGQPDSHGGLGALPHRRRSAPATLGKGFLIDRLALFSGTR